MATVLALGAARALAVGALLALASLVGHALLPAAARPRRARLRAPLELSAGVLALGWWSWTVGSAVGTWAAPLGAAALGALALRRFRPWLADQALLARELAARARRAPAAAALVAVPLALALPALLVPLSDSDGLRYHAALPKLFLLTGRVFLYPWDVTGALPQGAEMLTMLVFPLAGGEGAKYLHAAFFAATLALLPLLVPSGGRGRRAAGWLAAFLFAASPVALGPAPAGFVDHVALFHAAVALLLALAGAPPLGVGIALAAALFTKITLLPAAAIVLFLAIRRRPSARSALLLVVPPLLALAPLGVRNLLATGDPIYPVGYELAGRPVPGVDPAREAIVFRSERAAVAGFRLVPGGGRRDDALGAQHLLVPLALLLALRARRLRPFALFVIAFAGLAFVFHPPARFLLPGVLAAAVLEGAALARVLPRLSTAMGLLVALPALLTGGAILLPPPARAYVTGRIGADSYRAAVIPGWRAAALVNAQPGGGRVMALDFPAPYAFDRPWIVEGILNRPPLATWLREGADGPALLARLKALDVRYLVVTPGYGGGTNGSLFPLATSRESAAALLALRSRLRLVGRVDGVDVWAVP